MSLNKIFIDKDVLMDVLKKNQPYHKVSSELFLIYCDDVRSEVYTSSDIIKEIIEHLSTLYETEKILSFVDKILGSIRILEYGASEIKATTRLMQSDEGINFNTALHYIIIKNNRCSTIMTRNSFFKQAHNIKVINPIKLIDRN